MHRRFAIPLREQKWLHIVLLSGVAVALVRGPILHPDSDGYIAMSIYRSSLYPLFLAFCRVIGGGNSLTIAVFLQLIFGYLAIVITLDVVRRVLDVRSWVLWPAMALLAVPYVGGGNGNVILTEAITYPLFMLAMCALFLVLHERRTADVLGFLACVALLVLARRQFLFLFGAVPALLLWAWRAKARISYVIVGAATIAALVGTTLAEMTYQRVVNGRFTTPPMGGIHAIAAPLYYAQLSDSSLFTDPFERTLFVEMRCEVEARRDLPDSASPYHPFNYYAKFDNIVHLDVWKVLNEHGIEPAARDPLLMSMVRTLEKRHWRDHAQLYVNNVIYGFGGYFQAALIAVLMLVTVRGAFGRSPDFLASAVFMVTLVAAGNILAVNAIMPLQKRYTMYTDAFVALILLVAVARALESTRANGRSVRAV